MRKLTKTVSVSTLILFIHMSAMAQSTQVKLLTLPGKEYPLELWTYDINSDKYKFKEKLNLDEQGTAEFEITANPYLYQIKLGNKGVEFINDGDRNIEITIDMKANIYPPITVRGSEATNHYKDYLIKVSELQNDLLYPLEAKMKAALKSKDQKRIEGVEQEHQNNLKIFASTLYEKIQSMGSSLAVFAIVRTLDFNKYFDYIQKINPNFAEGRSDDEFVAKMNQMILDAKKIQIGEIAPDFELQTQNHGFQKLSDLKGGVTLIDFWASWCLPCIKENIEFKDIYENYRAKGFNIWAISLDKKEKNWTKSINKYDLPWTHSRLEDEKIKNLYKVVGLPVNFLLDKNGRIIARNINAIELSELLQKNFQ